MAKFYMSVARLRTWKACNNSCLSFIHLFGKGKVAVTKERWVQAHVNGLDVGWVFIRRYGAEAYYVLKYPRDRWGAATYNFSAHLDMWEYIKNVEGIDDNGNPTKT